MARYITDPVARECRRENVDPTAFLRVLDGLEQSQQLDEAEVCNAEEVEADAQYALDKCVEAASKILDGKPGKKPKPPREALLDAMQALCGPTDSDDFQDAFATLLDEALAAAKQEGTEAMQQLLGVE